MLSDTHLYNDLHLVEELHLVVVTALKPSKSTATGRRMAQATKEPPVAMGMPQAGLE